ncbi:hypothetical protein COLO4_25608 [Corchorus olitorius]|uniref:Uncharacterized protein n=1 Tax=Corchorus olitorius TaxID=93759 RepID=A0A1R3I119_9ROSI|nr:hypothetical protein COLO4_25608 [Corchorus olitorius]
MGSQAPRVGHIGDAVAGDHHGGAGVGAGGVWGGSFPALSIWLDVVLLIQFRYISGPVQVEFFNSPPPVR